MTDNIVMSRPTDTDPETFEMDAREFLKGVIEERFGSQGFWQDDEEHSRFPAEAAFHVMDALSRMLPKEDFERLLTWRYRYKV